MNQIGKYRWRTYFVRDNNTDIFPIAEKNIRHEYAVMVITCELLNLSSSGNKLPSRLELS